MTAPARFTKADMTRLFRAARESGFTSVRIEIDKDGRIVADATDTTPPTDDWRADQPLYSKR